MILFHTGLSLAYIAEEIHLTKSKDYVNISCFLSNSYPIWINNESFSLLLQGLNHICNHIMKIWHIKTLICENIFLTNFNSDVRISVKTILTFKYRSITGRCCVEVSKCIYLDSTTYLIVFIEKWSNSVISINRNYIQL